MSSCNGLPKPPLRLGELVSKLLALFSVADTRILLRAYISSDIPKSRMEQAVRVFKIAKEMELQVSIRGIAKALSVDNGDLSRNLAKTSFHSQGRPQILTQEEEEELILFIQLKAEAHKPCSPKVLQNYISEQFGKTVSRSWYLNFIERHEDKVCSAIAYPQESTRIRLTREAAIKHIKNIRKYVVDAPTELIFNLDEVGCQQWADKKPCHCIIPNELKGQRVEYEVDRSEKRFTVIATISMSGDVLTPLMVTHRKTIDKNVIESGIREGEDLILKSQQNSFVTQEIFTDYIRNVFIPYVDNIRQNQLYVDKPAVFLCDNCASHFDENLLRELARKNIRFVTFPPHSSHLFQPLDLVTFGVFKNHLRSVTSRYEKGSQLDRISRLLKAIEMATISENNRHAFARAGLEINALTKPNTVIFRQDVLLKRIDEAKLESNPIKTASTRFGFMNKEFF